jgi:hypothetical protein
MPRAPISLSGLLLLACGYGAARGSKKATITPDPEWNWPAYRSLAAVPCGYPRVKPRAQEAATLLLHRTVEVAPPPEGASETSRGSCRSGASSRAG